MGKWAQNKSILQDPNVDAALAQQDTGHLYKKLLEKKRDEWKQPDITYGPRPDIKSKNPYDNDNKNNDDDGGTNNNDNNDDELNALERELGLDGDDDDAILRNIQEQRKNELKKQWKNKQKNISKGNAGRYEEYDERQMLKEASKQNINMIIHFYADTIPRGLIVDEHFKKLAPKHMETKFIKLNARKSPFLVNKWKIKTLPSICIVQNGYLTDKIIGFDDFGGIDEFPTAAMERRFAKSGAIKDKNGKFNKKKKKTKVLTDL